MKIYFIQSGENGPIKIGITSNLKSRLSAMQSDCPFKLKLLASFSGSKEDEISLHSEFSDCKLRGEWFNPVSSLESLIESILQNNPSSSCLDKPHSKPRLNQKPHKDELLNLSREEIAEKFGVSEKTVIRWLKHHKMFEGKGRRLNQTKADKIRAKYKAGMSMKDLSTEYEVTFATISRVINNITYRIDKKTYAKVTVSYNPN
jgi:transposase